MPRFARRSWKRKGGFGSRRRFASRSVGLRRPSFRRRPFAAKKRKMRTRRVGGKAMRAFVTIHTTKTGYRSSIGRPKKTRRVKSAKSALAGVLVAPRLGIWQTTANLNYIDPTNGNGQSCLFVDQVLDPLKMDNIMQATAASPDEANISGDIGVNIESSFVRHNIKNQGFQDVEVDVWYGKLKHDIPIFANSTATVSQFQGVNPASFAYGVGDVGTLTTEISPVIATPATANDPTTTFPWDWTVGPENTSNYMRMFRLKKHGKRILRAGELWDLTVFGPSMVLKKGDYGFVASTNYTSFSSNFNMMRSGGYVVIIRARGTQTYDARTLDKSDPGTTAHNADLHLAPGSFIVGIMSDRKAKFRSLLATRSQRQGYFTTKFGTTNVPSADSVQAHWVGPDGTTV